MLIQNTINRAQAPLNVEVKPSVKVEQIVIKQEAEQQITTVQLRNVVDNINKAMKQLNRNLEFSVDTDTKKSIVKLVDSETGEVIRQIPSEEVLAISRSTENIQKGLLLKQKA